MLVTFSFLLTKNDYFLTPTASKRLKLQPVFNFSFDRIVCSKNLLPAQGESFSWAGSKKGDVLQIEK